MLPRRPSSDHPYSGPFFLIPTIGGWKSIWIRDLIDKKNGFKLNI